MKDQPYLSVVYIQNKNILVLFAGPMTYFISMFNLKNIMFFHKVAK